MNYEEKCFENNGRFALSRCTLRLFSYLSSFLSNNRTSVGFTTTCPFNCYHWHYN